MVLRCLTALICCLSISCISAEAQSIEPAAINASGGEAVSGGQVFEYSVGQLIPSTAQAPHTPGVLQPAWVVAGVDETTASASQKIRVFPDPMESVLIIQPELNGSGKLHLTLFDGAGKVLIRQEAQLMQGSERQELDVSRFAAGNYLLEVTGTQGRNSPFKASFKLQKLR